MEDDRTRLGALQDYFASHKLIPSFSEMQTLLSIKSKSGVAQLVARLRLQGFLEQAPNKRLAPGKRFFERPISGDSVQAGSPRAVYNDTTDFLSIDTYLVEKPSRTELLPVKGDSMMDVGIHNNDTVIIEKRHFANTGDIVVAIVDDEFTIKTLGKEKDRFVLIPANKAFPVIRPENGFEIYGVVVGMFRKYD